MNEKSWQRKVMLASFGVRNKFLAGRRDVIFLPISSPSMFPGESEYRSSMNGTFPRGGTDHLWSSYSIFCFTSRSSQLLLYSCVILPMLLPVWPHFLPSVVSYMHEKERAWSMQCSARKLMASLCSFFFLQARQLATTSVPAIHEPGVLLSLTIRNKWFLFPILCMCMKSPFFSLHCISTH